jgi:hypothetical protein
MRKLVHCVTTACNARRFTSVLLTFWAQMPFYVFRCVRAEGALLEALTNLLKQLLPEPDYGFSEHEKEIDALARDWFVKKSAKQEVLKILQAFGLNEIAIEAEAMRIKAGELELFDRMLTLARSRFDRAIRCVSEYKDSLARRLRQNADQILQTDHPPGLEYAPVRASAAA